jgi:hypothetical protein
VILFPAQCLAVRLPHIVRHCLALSRHDRASDHFDDLRDDGISEGSKSVHPSGKPIIHSVNAGVRARPVAFAYTLQSRLFSGTFCTLVPSFQSRAVGVGNIARHPLCFCMDGAA